VNPIWFAVAPGLPFLLTAAALGLHLLMGGQFTLSRPGPVVAILAVLVLGDEIGWRGFALPRLKSRMSGLLASAVLGVIWAAWHLANGILPGLGHYWTAFPAFLVFVLAQTVLFTWIANHTTGSVLLAWIFHAAINVAGAMLAIGNIALQWWLCGLAYMAAALAVALVPRALDGRQGRPRQIPR
jgi:membrane protease YdiL (CAAX protease family)